MARGWESKSVEAQIESAADRKFSYDAQEFSPAQMQVLREKENLELSRTRVIREIEGSTNPRYREMMRKALADLDVKLGQVKPLSKAAAGTGS